MAAAARPQLNFLHDALEDLKAKHVYTHLRMLGSEQKPVATVDGKEVINLASNNYFGLTTHPKLRKTSLEARENMASALGRFAAFPGR